MYETFKQHVTDLLKKKTLLDLNDIGGEETVKKAFEDGDSPSELVEFVIEKYDLDDVTEDTYY